MTDAGLQGRLADFNLQEILQLISLQQKTGLLTVDASYPMFLAFESGMLVAYRDRRRSGPDPLVGYLKRYGFFSTETWEHIDFVSHHAKLDISEILVNEGLLSAEELEVVQNEAAQEDIFHGMQLEDGRYHFVPGRDGLAGLKGRVRVKVDGLLMEAVRRIDEIDQLRERLPSAQTRLRRTDHEVDTMRQSDGARRVLALLGKGSTVGRIVAQARMSEFDTLQIIDELRADNLLVVQAPEQTREEDIPAEEESLDQEHGIQTAPLVITSTLALLLVAIVILLQPWDTYRDAETASRTRGELRESAVERLRVQAALQILRVEDGSYPPSLDALQSSIWLPDGQWENLPEHVRYRRVQGGADFELLPAEESR